MTFHELHVPEHVYQYFSHQKDQHVGKKFCLQKIIAVKLCYGTVNNIIRLQF